MTVYCPYCWLEIDQGATLCPRCGANLADDHRDYIDKLISALHHPEPFTQRRAAYVLGLLANPRSVKALATLLTEDEADPYVRAQAAEALGAVSTEQARSALEQAAKDQSQSVLVRQAALTALGAWMRQKEHDAA